MPLFSTRVPIALALFTYITFLLFSLTSARRAAGTAFVLGILFLPVFEFKIPHIPEINKSIFIGVIVTMFTFLYDRETWRSFRFRWFDVPLLLWCSSSLISSMTNELGLRDGLFATSSELLFWAVPYFVGRAYFSDSRQSRNLALGLFAGGVLYIPFCLYEIRMSPQLHNIFYGYHQHDFLQTIRFDGYRPMVFMNHGLMVGMWMTISCLSGFWLWKLNLFRKSEAFYAKCLLVLLFITTILVKSSGALILLVVGITVLLFKKQSVLKLTVLSLLIVPFVYIPARALNLWSGSAAVDLAANHLGAERAQSLAFRLDNETMLLQKTMERPFFGWGGWGRGRVYDEQGKDITVTDSLWIIAFSTNGFWGTFWLYVTLVLPAILYTYRKVEDSGFVFSAPMAVLCVGSLLYVLDTMLNNHPNPIYMIMLGAVNGMGSELVLSETRLTKTEFLFKLN